MVDLCLFLSSVPPCLLLRPLPPIPQASSLLTIPPSVSLRTFSYSLSPPKSFLTFFLFHLKSSFLSFLFQFFSYTELHILFLGHFIFPSFLRSSLNYNFLHLVLPSFSSSFSFSILKLLKRLLFFSVFQCPTSVLLTFISPPKIFLSPSVPLYKLLRSFSSTNAL